jgi:flavodoxin
MNPLIVFYSRDGSTRTVAQAIAEKLQCPIEEITELKSRKGFFGFMRSGYEATTKKSAKINPLNANPADFDLIIIGTPLWAGSMSSPIRAFITQFEKDLNKVAVFCSKGGTENHKAFSGVKEILKKDPIATLDLLQKEVQKNNFQEKVQTFVDKINNS